MKQTKRHRTGFTSFLILAVTVIALVLLGVALYEHETLEQRFEVLINLLKRIDDAVVTDFHVVLDIDEWIYLAVVSNLSLWRNLCLWTYYTSHNYKLLIINYKLLSSSTQCIVEVNHCLHLVEVISYLRKLYVEQ